MDPTPPSDLPDRLFEAALDHAAEDRDAFILGACGDDAALLAEVRALLAAHEEMPSGFLASPVAGEVPAGHFDATIHALDSNRTSGKAAGPVAGGGFRSTPVAAESSGDRIGPYKLLQEIGEGGFGTVWMAEQSKPISRKVALKVIKMGMDTREVIARFEAERQALAMMDHPNIAKVLDAGATDRGRPYFVMELVKGMPITQYCDEAGLGTRERLDLFGDVCAAINHAHQKGIIHRDIKPSNVMITLHGDKPVVKVIDFGIAKATQGKLTDKTLFTRFEQFIGTPVYMSPEQAALSAVDIDTRSDIYALGILLYELLTGKPPFDSQSLVSAGYEEMRRIIREEEPLRPSLRLATMVGEERTLLAKARHIEEGKLNKLVEPDLDWIVMKAIEKDRTRRYETANAFAQDIVRFLGDEAVSARPPSKAYQFKKFARRNKGAFRAAASITLLLVAATAVSGWQAVRATRAEQKTAETLAEVEAERDAKEKALQEAEAVTQFLTETFQSPDPRRDGREIKVVELLDVAARKLETDLAEQPERRAQLQATLAWTYSSLGLYQQANLLREQVRDYHLVTDGLKHPNTLRAMQSLTWSYSNAARLDDALKLDEELLVLSREVLGDKQPFTLKVMGHLASSYHAAGRLEEALKLREEVLARSRELKDDKHPDTLKAMHNLAFSYHAAGRLDEALKLREEMLALRREVQGDQPSLNEVLVGLANSYESAGRLGEARKLREEIAALMASEFWGERANDIRVSRLTATGLKLSQLPDDTWEVNLAGIKEFSDLTILQGRPIDGLNIGFTAVTDLGPLRGMALKRLMLNNTQVTDLSPLQGMKLDVLHLGGTQVTDLSPLRGMPLTDLRMLGCRQLTDLSPLEESKTLANLILPPNAKAIEFLRAIPTLERVSFKADADHGYRPDKTAEEFWKEFDAKSNVGGQE